MKDIEDGKIDVVITKDLSRLGRDYIKGGYYIEEYFREKNIRYIAINDNMDSTNEDSYDMLSFKLSFNDYYPRDISKKIRKVKRMKQEKGEYQHGHPPFGYKKSTTEKNKLVIDPETAPIIKLIFDLYLSGKGTRQIVQILYDKGIKTPAQYSGKKQYMKGNEYWQRSFIQKILHNQVYTGAVVSHTTSKVSYKIKKCVRLPKEEWIIVEDRHEPIISKEQFQQVQDLMKKRTSTRTRKYDHVLKGLVKCGHCGGTMTIKADTRTKGKVRLNFICSNRNGNKLNCDNSVIGSNIVLDSVLETLHNECKKIIIEPKELEETFLSVEKEINSEKIKIQEDIDKKQQKMERLDLQIKAIYNDKLEGILKVEDFLSIYQSKNEEKEKLTTELKELKLQLQKQENKKVVDYGELKAFAQEFLKVNNPSKEIISRLVDKIIVSKGRKITIKYKFSETKNF